MEEVRRGIAKLSVESGLRQERGSFRDSATESTPALSLVNADKARFNELVTQGKEKTGQGDLHGALVLYQNAFKIHKSQKLANRINKLKEFLSKNEEEEDEEEDSDDDDGMVEVANGFRLAETIYNALYPYQKNAVVWFWGLYKQNKGGILGDDMGLGKTIQVIAFLSGMFDSELIRSALIVMPVSVLENWEREWKKWAPGIRVKAFHGSSKKDRNRNLEKIQKHDGVCLTTYGMVVSNHEVLSQDWRGREFKWDYIILDEGHKIKNTTKTSKNVRAIPADHHFILTGTPVQNNLREMWALFDFVCQGKLLGTSRTFKQEYENRIVRARERDASAYEKRIGNEMSESLRKLIEPHFLRRTKAMVLEGNKVKTDSMNKVEGDKVDSVMKMPTSLTRKNDLIVWLYMSDTQIKIYQDFLGLERVKEILMSSRSALNELNVLKKITDHPRLLTAHACSQLGLNKGQPTDEDKENLDSSTAGSIFVQELNKGGISDKTLIQESGKVLFLLKLLDNLKAEGHRCLVFSQSRKMLDIIQRLIKHRGHKVLRIDGTISKTSERQHLITTFQNDPSYSCFLLTTQVGGVGITLTAADRVVIYDPSWNPATDAQAVDRVYRIGQKRTVVIYRLITCGTIEEKIYRKQVFKDALMQQTTGSSKNPFRYFTRQDLRDLFTLDNPRKSATQLQLDKMHSHNRKTDEMLDKHIHFLHSLNIFGISDHDLMYSQEAVITDDEIAEAGSHDAIQARVRRAQNMVAAESQKETCAAGSIPIDWPRLSAREKVQALNPFELFIPKRDDSKRFVQMGGKRRSDPKVEKTVTKPEVVDLSDSPTTSLSDNNRQPTATSTTDFVDLTVLEEPDYTQMEKSFSSLKLSEQNVKENQNNTAESVAEASGLENQEAYSKNKDIRPTVGDKNASYSKSSSDSRSEDEDERIPKTDTACSPADATGHLNDSCNACNSNKKGSMVEDVEKEASETAKEKRMSDVYCFPTVDDETTSHKDKTPSSAANLNSRRDSVDDDVIFVPRSERKFGRVRNVIISDDEDEDDENDKKPVHEHRRSISRRRSQVIYPSSSDENDSEDQASVNESKSEVEEAESAGEANELSDDIRLVDKNASYSKSSSDSGSEDEDERVPKTDTACSPADATGHSNDSHKGYSSNEEDDNVVFLPRSERKFGRVRKGIISDDDDDDENDEKPVHDRRRSISRRRSQVVYPSSSDENDSEDQASVNESKSGVEEAESAGEANELSDCSEISNRSQSEAVSESEETDTNHDSSTETQDQEMFNSSTSSYEGDPQETCKNDRLSQENRQQTSSACPSGEHASDFVNILKCPCVITEEQVVRYKKYLMIGREFELEGNEEEALHNYLSAIEIQDSDVRLHKKILVLHKKLEL